MPQAAKTRSGKRRSRIRVKFDLRRISSEQRLFDGVVQGLIDGAPRVRRAPRNQVVKIKAAVQGRAAALVALLWYGVPVAEPRHAGGSVVKLNPDVLRRLEELREKGCSAEQAIKQTESDFDTGKLLAGVSKARLSARSLRRNYVPIIYG